MRKKYIMVITTIFIIVNYVILFLLWLGWQLDYQYGDGHEIRESLSVESCYGLEALSRIYSGINYDIYYFAAYTIVLTACLIALVKANSKEGRD